MEDVFRNNKDIIMKATAEMFKDGTLEMLGLKTARIVDIMPTVLPVVEAAEKRVDFVFLLENDTLLHLEFQATVPENLLRRVAFYGARIVERHNWVFSGKNLAYLSNYLGNSRSAVKHVVGGIVKLSIYHLPTSRRCIYLHAITSIPSFRSRE
ncbi:hypothetical protein [Syntrophomonas wolfei]|jgi:hypothetical protein|nr:hypothetical protein [Syntrophomonas wolfei]